MQKLTQAEVKQHQYPTLNFLHLTAAGEASAAASAKSDPTAFAEALVHIERLGRLKLPNVWDIIFKCPLIVKPVSRIISCLPCTHVSVKRVFSHSKFVLRTVQMGNE